MISMFWDIFITRLKIIIRNKSTLFWTFAFPLILATLFNLAFSNILESEKFSPVKLGIVNNEEYKSSDIKEFIEAVSQEGDNQIFIPTYVSNEEEAKELLNDNKIVGYLNVATEILINVKASGLDQTIIKYTIDSYYQMNNVANDVINYDLANLHNGVLDKINNGNYFKNITNEKTNNIVIFFYTLIGMTCMFSGFSGISAVNDIEANLSKKGARISISPAHKGKILLISLLTGFLVQFVALLILFFYLTGILGIQFGTNNLLILLIMAIGCLTGVCLGSFISSLLKLKEGHKIGIFIAITLTFSFLSGMMVQGINYIIEKNVPLLARINPVNIVTDALYSLYYYDTLDRYWFNIINLGIIIIVLSIISYLCLRRKRYDSI